MNQPTKPEPTQDDRDERRARTFYHEALLAAREASKKFGLPTDTQEFMVARIASELAAVRDEAKDELRQPIHKSMCKQEHSQANLKRTVIHQGEASLTMDVCLACQSDKEAHAAGVAEIVERCAEIIEELRAWGLAATNASEMGRRFRDESIEAVDKIRNLSPNPSLDPNHSDVLEGIRREGKQDEHLRLCHECFESKIAGTGTVCARGIELEVLPARALLKKGE